MRMYARRRELDMESVRKWGHFLTLRLRAEEIGVMPIAFKDMRRIVYRVLGLRMNATQMQMPMEWRDRLKSAGLDESWNVLNETLWRHAVWQVETTGVYRPERQEGLCELISGEALESPVVVAREEHVKPERKEEPRATINGMEIPIKITRR